MGAFISTYGASEFPNSFRKIGSFSPAYWFAMPELNNYLSSTPNLLNHRIYFVAGKNESSSMVQNITTIRTTMQNNGLSSANTLTKIDAYGTHSENYWRGEFGAAYQWLFMNENLSIETQQPKKPVILQILSGKIWAEGFEENTSFDFYTMTGQKIVSINIINGINILPDTLKKGIYILKAKEMALKIVVN